MDYKEKVIALLDSKELSQEQKEKLESIFPELKESEDERIRKELIFYLRYQHSISENFEDIGKWIAWLEKQGEQKPWSEEDEDILNTIINHFEIDLECTENDDIIKWLKSLRPQLQWKPSDEQMKAIEHICDGNYNVDLDILDSIYRDFKKLRGE